MSKIISANESASPAKPVIPAMRWMLYTTTLLVLGAGLDLFIFPETTDRMFAWEIQPALTAAFLGANYLAACVLEFGAARETVWARARVVIPAILLFTTLTALLTLKNFNSYNFGNPATWIWVVFYFAIPPVLVWVWWKQSVTPGAEPPREAPLPRALLSAMQLTGVGMIGSGLLLALAPKLVSPFWPWALAVVSGYGSVEDATMQTYVGTWLLAWGVVMLHASIENDRRRTRHVFTAFTVLAGLQAVALWRFHPTVVWGLPATFYLAALALLAAIGIWGWLVTARAGKS